MSRVCSNIQASLDWCEGMPSYPGLKRRVFYISKGLIVSYPKYQKNSDGKIISSVLDGSFVLAADATFKYIDFNAAKNNLTSEPQGESPSQTQLNKFVGVHPGTDEAATNLAHYVNNDDILYIVQDMQGKYRVLGNDMWPTTSTVNQENGEGPTGTAGTTLNVEVTDVCPAPFYKGTIVTEDGTIDCSDDDDSSSD